MVTHFLNQYFEERVEATEGIFTSIGWSQRGMKLQGRFSWGADGQRKFRMQFSRKMQTVFFPPGLVKVFQVCLILKLFLG